MDIVLIPGLWLDASSWNDVARELRSLGHRPVALDLPGQGDGCTSATLDDHVRVVVAAVDASSGPPLVVGPGDASTLAWLAADRRPDKVAGVVCVGHYPVGGGHYADFYDHVGDVVPFPGWEAFDDTEVVDLDASLRRRIARGAVPVPVTVVRSEIHVRDARRMEVPVTLVGLEITAAEARSDIEGGDVPELETVRHLDLVDLGPGSWPQFSRPVDLAGVISAAAHR